MDDQTTGQLGIDPSWEPEDIYTMTSLEQVRVVADPLRVSILEALCLEARTTKQVAELLGEKPTRLYHHVDALALGLKDRDICMIRVEGERTLIFGDVLVRVDPDYRLAMHIDTDEANAANLRTGMTGHLANVQDRR